MLSAKEPSFARSHHRHGVLHVGRRERASDGVAADWSGRAAGSGFRGTPWSSSANLLSWCRILDAPVPQLVDKLEDGAEDR